MSDPKPLLVLRHVSWEGPHRILDAFDDRTPVRLIDTLESDEPLPGVAEVAGAVVMGGPMSANDTGRFPRLEDERRWMREAVAAEVPVLGVCLGAQLLARALGATVAPGPAKELGFAPIDVLDTTDPLLDPLAADPTVLHWHGEVFTLPEGAVALARTASTAVQAFRAGTCAWGLLFHAEADPALVDRWLAEPTMAAAAEGHLGSDYRRILRGDAARLDPAVGQRVFAAFAARCRGASGP